MRRIMAWLLALLLLAMALIPGCGDKIINEDEANDATGK